ncbi:MAG: DUF4384 domain-containing protein [Bryobacterales bacterium]|nr:DUF4384 domain-containing protein [Bryobacterales bacterium]
MDVRVLWLGCILSVTGTAAGQDDGLRQIWDSGFRQKRPAGKVGKARPAVKYSVGAQSSAPVGGGSAVGVTVWRLREPNAGDGRAPRLLVYRPQSKEKVGMVAERVSSGTALANGTKVRVSIEVPRDGYLYVIDREKFRGGKTGDPFLVFPQRGIRKGDNRVQAGMMVDIPAQTDELPAMTLEMAGADQVGEELLIVVTGKPLEELAPGAEARRLPRSLVEKMEREWGQAVTRLDLAAGSRDLWTELEKSAAGEGGKLLTQDDPMPQMLLHVAANAGQALLFRYEIAVE